MGDPLTMTVLAGLCLGLLAACEWQREGPQALPQAFIGSKIRLFAHDLVEVNVTALRPRPGALLAYADCVGARFGHERGQTYARRVKSVRLNNGMADAVGLTVTYLLSHVRPEGDFVLTSQEVLAKCRANGIPTV